MQYKIGEALLLETGRMSLAAGLFCVVNLFMVCVNKLDLGKGVVSLITY